MESLEIVLLLIGYCRGRVNSIAIHPTGKIALSVGIDRAAIVWNLMTGRKASVNKLGKGMWNSDSK